MKNNACFRVSVDEMAKDLAKYVELARTRTFEIWRHREVQVMLVRIEAVQEWHDQLQIAIPATLMTDQERASLLRGLDEYT